MTRETRQRQKKNKKNPRWRHLSKLCRNFKFSGLWPIWSNLEAGFRTHGLYRLTFSLIATLFYLTKMKTELKNLQHSSHTIALSKVTIFDKKCWFISKKVLTSKLRGSLNYKVYFLKLNIGVCLRTKFQVSIIFLTSLRQGWYF